jgi:arginine utilization regulatory protein
MYLMNLLAIANLLEDYVSGFVILNNNEEIILADDSAMKLSLKGHVVGKAFKESFDLDVNTLINDKKVIKTQFGEKYTVSAKEIDSDGERFIAVIFNSLDDFNNNSVKLHCLEKIVDTINDGVIISDYKGSLVLYNRSQEDLEGMRAKEVVGKYLWQAYDYNPEMSEHRKVFNSGKPIINAYSAHAYKNGDAKYLSYSTYPIKKDGETIAVYTISRNETSLKNLLNETIELKRKLFSTDIKAKEVQNNNGTRYTFEDIKSRDAIIKTVIKESQKISLANNNILIVGETGTGKELFAQGIHNFGHSQSHPFIAINCAAIPDNLLESTLFGTVKGSYTGSVDQMGFFEASREGTLFLDEINSLSVTLQSKLLRVIEEKLVRRVGGLKAIRVKCRLICAANKDPVELIKQGKLREDFFYRIAGAVIQIPPLRQRKADIIHLSDFFINKYNNLLGKQIVSMSPDLKETFLKYYWPGNVRELEHIIESMVIKAEGKQNELNKDNLPSYFINNILNDNIIKEKEYKKEHTNTLPKTLRNIEELIINESLEKNGWNLTKTAKDLGIIRQSLNYRMKKLNIIRPK